MTEDDPAVSRMLANYRELIRHIIVREISADEFETDFLARFKDDPDQVVGDAFDLLDELFADVDEYVSDPALREAGGGISSDELGERAEDIYARLFPA